MRTGTEFVPADCRRCGLCDGRSRVVPAEGGARPRVFFVGEAPGPDEDQQGRPFVGRAGKILRAALEGSGWGEADVWITNVVKCFPHHVEDGKRKIRAPQPDETAACRPHLQAEFEALRPQLVVALGRTALEGVTGLPAGPLAAARGESLRARREFGGAPVLATFHPSGLHYERGRKESFEADLRRARTVLEDLRTP